jgi:SRSO17 transposase
VAAAAIVGDGCWLGKLHDELHGLLAPVFAQARSRLAAFAYIGALLAEPGDRRSCWQLAERAGHATPRRMQALLAEHAWDWKQALNALQRFILALLGDPGAVLVIDETAELKKGQMTVGVARQHAGITGQVENCQTVVNCAYVTGRAHALFDFRLYLPKAWCRDRKRRERARIPRDVQFQTKTELATGMVAAAVRAAVPFGWAAGDEVYGRSSKLRKACEDAGKGYVFAVPVNFTVRLPSGLRVTVAFLAGLMPASAWEARSCGRGCKGHRDYAWGWAATCSPRHWVLIRRSLSDPSDLAYFYCHAPAGRPVALSVLIAVTGRRWPVEECHQQAKGRPDSISIRSGSGTPSTATRCCPCALSPCSPSLLPGSPRPPRYYRPRTASRATHAPSPQTGPTPASCPPAQTSRRPQTPAWSRSASPKPAACCTWPPRPRPPPPASSATPGPAGGENTKPAPDTTTTRRGSGQPPHDQPTDNKPGL